MTATKPIRLTDPEVRAILARRKTQLRLVVTRKNSRYMSLATWSHLYRWNEARVDGPPDPIGGGDGYQYLHVPAWNPVDGPAPMPPQKPDMWYRVRPRMEPGDLLWVQETWSPDHKAFCPHYPVAYRADGYPSKSDIEEGHSFRWRSSYHMPIAACRLWLRVTDVGVQRVQEISAKDIIAEGAVVRSHDVEAFAMIGANPKCPVSAFDNCVYPDLRSLWAAGWDSINGKRPGCSWADNPWVWAITFERTEAPRG